MNVASLAVVFGCLAGQLVTSGPHEVMVSSWVEYATSVMVEEAAKAEAANKTTVENCIVIEGLRSDCSWICFCQKKKVNIHFSFSMDISISGRHMVLL